MAEPMDEFDGWLRQRLAATRRDAESMPRRRLLLPSVAAERVSARRSGFIAGALTTAVVLGMAWGGVTLFEHRSNTSHSAGTAPANTPTPLPQSGRPAGSVVATIRLPDSALTVVATSGAVWVPDSRTGTLLRIDPATNRIAASIDVARPAPGFSGATPQLAVAGDSVLVTSPSDETLVRVDAATNRVVARIPLGEAVDALAVSGQAAWLAARRADQVLRVDLAGDRVTATIPVTEPQFLAADPTTPTLWVVSPANGVLTRVDTTTNRAVHAFTSAPGHDYTLSAASSGGGNALWVRNLDTQSVERFDGTTDTITDRVGVGGPPSLTFAGASSIAATSSAVWVAVSNSLVRVDPATSQVSRLPLADPTGIAVDGGTIWVTTAQSTLVRVAAAEH